LPANKLNYGQLPRFDTKIEGAVQKPEGEKRAATIWTWAQLLRVDKAGDIPR
jgi:hypothetical protein